jgi:uncharacterized tellurite resistance protein B-like protein
MSVVRADQEVLTEELELVQSFFSHQLKVSAERLESIRELVTRYAVEPLPEECLLDTLGKLPQSARHLLFSVALEIAVVDDDLADAERNEIQKIGRSFGLSSLEIQSRLLEVVRRSEDAFSLLGVEPDSDWATIQRAYQSEKDKYSPTALSKLGVAFQSLALDRLERIEWAYQTLEAIYAYSDLPGEKERSVPSIKRKIRPKTETWTEFQPGPTEEYRTESDFDLWQRLPEILEKNWQGTQRDWDVFKRRLGLFGNSVPSLDELGQEYGISRERVRQIENLGRRVVRALLLTGNCEDQSIHPRIVELCRSVFGAIQSAIAAPVMRQNEFVQGLEKELGWKVFSSTGLYPIIEEWLELNHVEMFEDSYVFHSHSSRDIHSFELAARALTTFLSESGTTPVQKAREALHRELSILRCPPEDFFPLVPGVSLERGFLSLESAAPSRPSTPEVLEVELMTDEWDPNKIGDLVEGYFSRHFLTSVSFRLLGLHIQTKTGLPFRIASDVLRQHPAVARERVRGRIFARLRRNWREEEAAKRAFSQPTVQELVDDFLRERVRGDTEVALGEILEELARETGASAFGLADFVERSEHCRRFDRGGQTWVTSVPHSL